MSFTVIPRGRKPKLPIPLHRYMCRECRDIEHITQTALTCPPIATWSQYPLENIVRAVRNGADELKRAIELRGAGDPALAGLRQRRAVTMLAAARFDAVAKLFEDYGASVAEIPTMSFGGLLRVPAAAWDRILSEGYPPTPSRC
jgi:hypothetical protein